MIFLRYFFLELKFLRRNYRGYVKKGLNDMGESLIEYLRFSGGNRNEKEKI